MEPLVNPLTLVAFILIVLLFAVLTVWSIRRQPNEGKDVEREWFDSIK